ncbi:hypothetical protein VVORL1506_02601 [Vibrio vulnificus]|nr:hypothetical protein VVORL1506_02601 [Vibrio vulnificus]
MIDATAQIHPTAVVEEGAVIGAAELKCARREF